MNVVYGVAPNSWSEEEDAALKTFYPRHGASWNGWAEVLPGRTEKAISGRAGRLGVIKERPKPKPKRSKVPKPEPKLPPAGPSGYDDYVRRCMRSGMAPSQIDSMMGWWPGKTIRILTTMWDKETEK